MILSLSARAALVDRDHAWPRTPGQIRAWRAMAWRGLAVESTGVCEGCASRRHRPGEAHIVPVFTIQR